MKKFALFAGNDCYPEGGISDFVSDFSDLKEAKKVATNAVTNGIYEWYHIVNTETFDVVEYR